MSDIEPELFPDMEPQTFPPNGKGYKKRTNKENPSFPQFWDSYALKRDRMAAERAWNRLSAKDKRAAMAGIAFYREDCHRRGINMMYAQGYLNHHRWEDEIAESPHYIQSYEHSDTHTATSMAEQRKEEVRELSRLAAAGAAALCGFGEGEANE